MLELIPIFQGTPSYGEVSQFIKHQVVLQPTEADCGAACLASVAKYYGKIFSLHRLAELLGTGQQCTTLLSLQQGAEAIGFNARIVRGTAQMLDQLEGAPLPAILSWERHHWVVLYGKQGEKYVIADPAIGIISLSRSELVEGWTDGGCLLLEPDPDRFFLESHVTPATPWQKWLRRLWFYRSLLLQVLSLNLVIGCLGILFPLFVQLLVDNLLTPGYSQLLISLIIAVIILMFFRGGLQLIQSQLMAHFAQRVQLGLVMEFGRNLLRLPLNFYETHQTGDVISRLKDVRELHQLITGGVINFPSQLFIMLSSLGLMLIYSFPLTIVAGILFLMTLIFALIPVQVLQVKNQNLFVYESQVQSLLSEIFQGSISLKASGLISQFWQELQSRLGRIANVAYRWHQWQIFQQVFLQFSRNLSSLILLGLGSQGVVNQSLSLGQLLGVVLLYQNWQNCAEELVKLRVNLGKVKLVTKRLTEIIERRPETQGDYQKPTGQIPGRADIIASDITFYYPGRVNVLDNFSVRVPGGKIVALIGESGCGKSTLAKLMAGLYPLTGGNLRIGIYNLPDIPLDCLRKQVVFVPSETQFWSRSILDNLRLTNPELSFQEVVLACQITGADEFISQLPEKYQTQLHELGYNLSTGQRQQLAIARGIVNDPPVLILDESTAYLDGKAESQLLEQLFYQRQDKTTLVITHKPQVIRRADWVIWLEKGQVKMAGTPEELRMFISHVY